MVLHAGAAKVPLGVPVGAPLDGYAGSVRTANGVLDSLHARAIVLESKGRWSAVLGLDLLGMDAEVVARVRRAAEDLSGVPAASIMVACTHTHSGPRGFRRPDLSDPSHEVTRAMVVSCAARCIADARAAARPVAVEAGRAHLPGVGRNRRAPGGPVDEDVHVVGFLDQEAGVPLAVLVNYGCHPTALGANTHLISGDFFGLAARALEAEGFAAVALLTNGGLGDVSTRHTRQGEGPDEACRLAALLAAGIREAFSQRQAQDATLRQDRVLIHLPLVSSPRPAVGPNDEVLGRLASESDPARRRAAQDVLGEVVGALFRQAFAPGPVPIEIQALSIGQFHLVTLPGEPFAALVQRVKASSPSPLAVVGVCNGYIGYLPTADAFKEGGYEVAMCLFGDDVEDRILAAVSNLLATLQPRGVERLPMSRGQ